MPKLNDSSPIEHSQLATLFTAFKSAPCRAKRLAAPTAVLASVIRVLTVCNHYAGRLRQLVGGLDYESAGT